LYEFLYSNVTELRRLCTQPRSDFVFHLFTFVKLLAGQIVSLNAKANGNRWERGLGCERDGLQ
jgi:hypothetical protein